MTGSLLWDWYGRDPERVMESIDAREAALTAGEVPLYSSLDVRYVTEQMLIELKERYKTEGDSWTDEQRSRFIMWIASR